MYMEIHQLLKQGFTKVQVAQKLDISRSTVYRYLERNPEAMSKWVKKTKVRRKKLDPYKDIILSWLFEHPDMSAAQVLDWLQERYPNLKVAESTVRLYVRELRKEYDIPKKAATVWLLKQGINIVRFLMAIWNGPFMRGEVKLAIFRG